ncbi:MAG: hypothetical protein OEL53_17865 [Rhodospirillales bacterium]|nr:hypothetical protein [Rhodospirillales bacterium]
MTLHRIALLFCLISPVFYGLAAILLFDQDANWDLRNYHYYNAFAFLEGGRPGDLLAANKASFYNPLVDLPFYLADRILPARLTGFLLGLVQGLNLPLLFLLARNLLSGLAPWPRAFWAMGLALAGMTGGGVLGEIGAVFYDNIVSLGFLGALLLVVAQRRTLTEGPWQSALPLAALSGLMVGLAFGLKQPWVVYCVGICFALLFLGGSLRRRFLLSFCCGLGVLAGFALFGGGWALHLAELTGNPLFPYFNNIFQAAWAPANEFRDTTFLPRDALDCLLRPFQILLNPLLGGEAVFRAPALPIAYALLPLAGLSLLWRRKARTMPAPQALTDRDGGLYLILVALLAYAAWLKLFAIYRYAIGIEMISPLLIVLLLDRFGGGHAWKLIALAGALALSILYAKPADWGRTQWTSRYVEAAPPALEAPERTAIFFASGEPTSYLIPFFPKDVRWLRLDSGFPGPRPPSQPFNAHRLDILKHLDRDLRFVLILPKDRDFAQTILALYGLDYDPTPCKTVTSNLMPSPYALCAVRPAKGQEH